MRARLGEFAVQVCVVAEMVDVVSLRDWPDEQLIGHSMGWPQITHGDVEVAIASTAFPGPQPAAVTQPDACKQAEE